LTAPSTPLATYRLQLSEKFTLREAKDVVPYLASLGVSHVYASPLQAARPHSTHGYDVVDHGVLNPELGDEDDLEALARALARHEMGLVIDVVPNHMCIADAANTRWWDVLENGQGSASTDFFDINWGPPKPELAGKVLLPILGEQFGRELESGTLAVGIAQGVFHLSCGPTRLPLTPPSWRLLMDPLWRRVAARLGGEAEPAVEIESVLRALANWPREREQLRARRHERNALVRRIAQLLEAPETTADLAEVLRVFNGTKDVPRSFDELERLIGEQPYRLAHWRVAAHEINYRRFFDINDLAAIRVEREDVFRVVHALPLYWAERGWVDGFRIDHVDGLLEPERYLTRLRDAAAQKRGGAGVGEGGAAPGAAQRPYVVVEKILAERESLSSGWAVDGTTGYDHLATNAVLVDGENAALLRDNWRALTHDGQEFGDIAYESKRLILDTALAAELTVLAQKLDGLSEQHRYTRDFTFASLLEALREVLSCFPVYRTYIERDDNQVSERDRVVISRAIRDAVQRNPVINRSLFGFIEDLLLLRDPSDLSPEQSEARRDFVLRLQQLTGPVMAKGVEDTACYRFFPLLSLAEVGCDPDRLGLSVEEFHRFNADRAATTPGSLSATATHDTKRGEDSRARLHVLSERPQEFRQAVLQWRELNRPLRLRAGSVELPEPLTEVFIYQSLVGSWPAGGVAGDPTFARRFAASVEKAIAEAKLHTSWINPDSAYEEAVSTFVASLLDPVASPAFLESLQGFVERLAPAGRFNSLAQALLKVASPGVPDLYWGTELWDHSFADPDNRRPVDFARRAELLARLRGRLESDPVAAVREALAQPEDGVLKLLVLHRALGVRAAHREAFESRLYEPVSAQGPLAANVIAFARGETGRRVVAVTGRLFSRLVEGPQAPIGNVWRDTTLRLEGPARRARYREALTNRPLQPERRDDAWVFALPEVFGALPLALIEEMA
jgi:(1->4)-alpha-D-glucan 1-alpha-D-glucosylmutase